MSEELDWGSEGSKEVQNNVAPSATSSRARESPHPAAEAVAQEPVPQPVPEPVQELVQEHVQVQEETRMSYDFITDYDFNYELLIYLLSKDTLGTGGKDWKSDNVRKGYNLIYT